jgi:hypothetical protein
LKSIHHTIQNPLFCHTLNPFTPVIVHSYNPALSQIIITGTFMDEEEKSVNLFYNPGTDVVSKVFLTPKMCGPPAP